jgi:hypothetical protein
LPGAGQRVPGQVRWCPVSVRRVRYQGRDAEGRVQWASGVGHDGLGQGRRREDRGRKGGGRGRNAGVAVHRSSVQKQLASLHAFMGEHPQFCPDGKSVADLAARLEAADVLRSKFFADQIALNQARGKFEAALERGHGAAVAVYATLGSCYREDANALEAIKALPTKDRSPAETLSRMEAISKLWERLPNAAGMSGPVTVGAMDRAGFAALAAEVRALQSALVEAEQQFKVTAVAFNQEAAAMAGFVSAALIQGRALFPSGSTARHALDGIRPKKRRAKSTAEEPAEPEGAASAGAVQAAA